MPVLLVDYGEVISLPQPEATIAQMASLVGLEVPRFEQRYWEHRPAYDSGGNVQTYWSQVSDGTAPDEQALARLVRLDVEGWLHLNQQTLQALEAARARGWSLSLLSNAPRELAEKLAGQPALDRFEHLIFSSQIGVSKPDRAAFDAAVGVIGAPRHEILFVDDRASNVEAAIGAGLSAVRFTTPDELRDRLDELHGRRDELRGRLTD